ncbi:MAG: FKBP-type peptidyl-prolyl cis-trans isomerase [Flavobacteriales bacterium]|nr:FKBP-type peptidyl-prolyl cis-trans isomerase [Flavobacteriales bacterium]
MKSLISFILSATVACGGQRTPTQPPPTMPSAEERLKENRDAVRLEEHDIDLFEQRMGLKLHRSDRGVRFLMLRDQEGEHAKPQQWAKVNYVVELLNGDTAYSTALGEPESFLVEMDQVESGLHEAIQWMSPGDSALVVIPSYRAHGLIGDQDRIPMRSSVVYHIGLVAVSVRP